MSSYKEFQTDEKQLNLTERTKFISETVLKSEEERHNIAISEGFESVRHMDIYIFFEVKILQLESTILELLQSGHDENSVEVQTVVEYYESVKEILDLAKDPSLVPLFYKLIVELGRTW